MPERIIMLVIEVDSVYVRFMWTFLLQSNEMHTDVIILAKIKYAGKPQIGIDLFQLIRLLLEYLARQKFKDLWISI